MVVMAGSCGEMGLEGCGVAVWIVISEMLTNNSDLCSQSADKQPKCHRLEEVPVCAGLFPDSMSNDFFGW